ncbi:hypothetical protein [Halpernia frigidisoli]|uniref:Uncharacterized protein n=1 Tax=Halpernia frigidisoli TaxID=1125876 RepID=A0A1I3EC24_9FLAO|nr:hypothetical protein [Halpernia frigidisoli]SFH96530.1 hypothetical protein SAMN05443292_0991 [Halpernia frigidisoli]
MEILVHPSSSEEQNLLESLLKKMKISFERKETSQKIIVSDAEMESISRGLEQANNGGIVSSVDVHNKAKLLCVK